MKLSVLCAVRPNSDLLAHFIIGFFDSISDETNTELLMMLNQEDEWNKRVARFFGDKVKFFYENLGKGRWGHHLYLNELMSHADGDWVVLMCEDFEFLVDGWDNYLREHITSHGFDGKRIYAVLPRFPHSIGNVCQVLSRGYIDVVGNVLSGHYSVDSWVNTVLDGFPDDRKSSLTDVILFDDYTHTTPKRAMESHTKPIGCSRFSRGDVQAQVVKMKNAIAGEK